MTEQTDLAARIATEAHEGQTRWDKRIPYITHPQAVARSIIEEDIYDEEHVAAAWLHDVIEDTDWTYDKLLEAGVDWHIADAVRVLSKKEGQSYVEYILKVAEHSIARVVKMHDLKHNMSDLKSGSMKQKYELAYYILETYHD